MKMATEERFNVVKISLYFLHIFDSFLQMVLKLKDVMLTLAEMFCNFFAVRSYYLLEVCYFVSNFIDS